MKSQRKLQHIQKFLPYFIFLAPHSIWKFNGSEVEMESGNFAARS